MLKLALVCVTTRIVLRKKSCEVLHYRRQDHVQSDSQMPLSFIANRLQVLSHPHFDHNSIHRIALILVDVLLQHN